MQLKNINYFLGCQLYLCHTAIAFFVFAVLIDQHKLQLVTNDKIILSNRKSFVSTAGNIGDHSGDIANISQIHGGRLEPHV